MVTITARNGVTLSAHATRNGFPPATLATVYKVQRHDGDFAACDLGRKRRQARRDKQARRAFFADRS